MTKITANKDASLLVEGDVEVFAEHNYGEYFETTLEEFNAMPHSDEEDEDDVTEH